MLTVFDTHHPILELTNCDRNIALSGLARMNEYILNSTAYMNRKTDLNVPDGDEEQFPHHDDPIQMVIVLLRTGSRHLARAGGIAH